MGKKKVVLDTNILISTLGWKGKPREIFNRIIKGEFELMISTEQIEELSEAMNYPKLGFTEEQKLRFLTLVLEIANLIELLKQKKPVYCLYYWVPLFGIHAF